MYIDLYEIELWLIC